MAASDALIVVRPNTAFRLYLPMGKNDGTLVEVAWSSPTITVNKDAATSSIADSPHQIGTTAWGYVDFTAVEIGTSKVITGYWKVTNTDAIPTPFALIVVADSEIPVNVKAIGDGLLTAAKFASDFFTAVWTSATRTLTSFGTLVADTASAVWAEDERTLTEYGTIEDQLNDIEDLLTAPFEVTYTNPVNPSTQALEMWLDDDYTILSGRELANWSSDSWLDYDLEHAEWIKFYYVDKFNTETEIGTVTVENDNKTLHAEFTKAEKLAAKLVVDYEYTYKVRTMLDDDHGNDEITLVTGNLGIRD